MSINEWISKRSNIRRTAAQRNGGYILEEEVEAEEVDDNDNDKRRSRSASSGLSSLGDRLGDEDVMDET